MKKAITIICILGLSAAYAATASAEVLLLLDARAPGGSPSTEWVDRSANNAAFTVGNGAPTHGAGTGTYAFDGDDQFLGSTANESLFDFDVDVGTGADEFTVVFYAGVNTTGGSSAGDTPPSLVAKHADNTDPGWVASLTREHPGNVAKWHGEARVDNFNRTINRATGNLEAIPGFGPAGDLHLYVMHFTGIADTNTMVATYLDGNTTAEPVDHYDRDLNASILNDAALRIGGQDSLVSTTNGYRGAVQFIEIYSGATIDNSIAAGLTPADYSAVRFANLDVVLPAPEIIGSPVATEVFGFELFTADGLVYRLESTTNLVGGSWVDTGARILGNSQTNTFFDPAGFSTSKTYRVGIGLNP